MSDAHLKQRKISQGNQSYSSYEQFARHVLGMFAGELDISEIQADQELQGKVSGVTWHVEGKAVLGHPDKFFIIECKRYLTSKVKQETVIGLSGRIRDTGAQGGIIVSHLGLQKGAKRVAAAYNIYELQLPADQNFESFVARFLDKVLVKLPPERASLSVGFHGGEYKLATEEEKGTSAK